MEHYFSLRSLESLCSKVDEAFPGAVSFQQDGFDLQLAWCVWEEDLASPFKAEAPAGPGEQRGVLVEGDTWGDPEFSARGAAAVALGWRRTQLSTCPSFLPLPWGEAELTQAAPALPDVLGAPPWAGIGSVWDGLVPKTELNRAFQPSWLHRHPAGKGQGQRKVGKRWRRG